LILEKIKVNSNEIFTFLKANPLLEAFGNAKTTRNNNSSRFGKFIELHFNEQFKVAGGYISHYLLEKSRICVQSEDERNYHIFYRLCAGANDKLKSQLFITKPQDFHYLNRGCTKYFDSSSNNKDILKDTNLDDKKDFLECDKALEQIGLSAEDKLNIYKTVSSVLHIGNLDFEDDSAKSGCRLTTKGKNALKVCSSMLGLDEDELQKALTTRIMQANKGGKLGTIIMIPLKVSEAQNARDALAKAIYVKLFEYIVSCVNKAIPFTKSFTYIGILDTAGFEFFKTNSFEQFCINYCNEKLQQFFNERIFKEEQHIYEKECLNIKKIDYIDNQDCIELFEQKLNGLFDLLNEESKLPQPRAENFTVQSLSKNKTHTRIDFPRKSKLKSDRELRDDEGFLIRHFAGPVVYTTSQFIEKNNDALHSSLACLVQECKNEFIKNLFDYKIDSKQNIGKLNFESVSGKFRTQLNDLMEKLRSTGTSFIRCIKPNAKMISNEFSGFQVLTQLQSSGMTHVLELMQKGFPSRTSFNDLYETYKKNLPSSLLKLEKRIFCKALFKVLNLKDDDFKFGLTKVFFRPGKFAEFDQIMKNDQENISILIGKLKKWLVRTKWKRFIWCCYSVIKLKNKITYRQNSAINIQKNVRMWLIKKKYNKRIKALVQLRLFENKIKLFETNLPKNEKKDDLLSKINELKKKLADKMNQLKQQVR
jgi:myosin VI